MTLTEDLALLLHDPASGKAVVDGTALPRVLAGALVLDLVETGRARVDERRWSSKLVVVDRSPAGDPLLDLASARLMSATSPRSTIEKLHRKVREPTMERLEGRGLVRRDEQKVLGLFPATRWPAVDSGPRDDLVARLQVVLTDVDGQGAVVPDEHETALVSLVRAVKAEPKLVAGPRAELRAHSKEIAEGEWAGAAVRTAIASVHAAAAGGSS